MSMRNSDTRSVTGLGIANGTYHMQARIAIA